MEVKVHIRWRGGQAEITGLPELPHRNLVMAALPAAMRRQLPAYIRKYATIYRCIADTRDTIPLQVWADAIGAAAISSAACALPEATAELRDIARGGYLAVGESVYKLQTVAHVTTNRALAVIKRRIVDAANLERDSTLADARAAAAALTTEAIHAKAEADRILRQAKDQDFPPPSIVNGGWPLKRTEACWEVGIHLTIVLHTFEYIFSGPEARVAMWEGITDVPAVRALLWLPFTRTGTYSVTSCHMDRGSIVLPHVSYTGACMAPQEMPASITNANDVMEAQRAINRCLTGVTLHSLYQPPSSWLPRLKQFIPERLLNALSSAHWQEAVTTLAQSQHATTTTVAQEAEETWQA